MINEKDYTYEEFVRICEYQNAFRQLAREVVPYRYINLLMSAFVNPQDFRLSLIAWYDYLPYIEKQHMERKKKKQSQDNYGIYSLNMTPLYLWRANMRTHSRLKSLKKKFVLDKSCKG